MAKKGINIKHSKLRGEVAELRFMVRAADQGLRVIKPWGDSSRRLISPERPSGVIKLLYGFAYC